MTTGLTSVRLARPDDAPDIAAIHEDAWRHAYQGVIPHIHLSQMIARRGPGWWQKALTKGVEALLLDFDGEPAAYATLGASRLRGTPYLGEIFELYVRPDFHGVGFGGRLFREARKRLSARGLNGLCVWALADNDQACAFYLQLGGKAVSEGVETFGDVTLRKVAFAWR
jgi:ribosomal protein S18 acetylase RimI-like enzyme